MDKMTEGLISRIVRVGTVMSVNYDEHKARVLFPDLGYTSGWLKVLCNEPHGKDKTILHVTEDKSGGSGDASFQLHNHDIIVKQWMPKVNDTVLCLYIPAPNGDGYILGGIA